MRILTWNVNVLRTVLDYHPWSSMKNKTVEGLLDELEHKTRRPQVTKAMACPGHYDGFWTWPRSKSGYSGVCTYVNSRLCVPLRAEEGITGLLLSEPGGAMRPPWTDEEKIGCYPDIVGMDLMDEVDGSAFDPRGLDMEGRAVVLDLGMFVLFNLYCPNETNDTRRPYKMNFLHVLQARVDKLVAAGREVVIAGDMNVMRAPIDSGEGGIKSTAEQHYEHPARRWFDAWCAPKGPMVDVVRESFPSREGMFTCWNTKIDARSANYGSRIDYILCTPGLRPWIKGGDIQAELYGSDHCPVYVDFHDSITTEEGKTLYIRDLLNPPDRPPSTAPVYPSDIPRDAPEPPRFATKFLEEFSAKQRTLMSLWGGKKSSASPAPDEKVVKEEQSQESQGSVATQATVPTQGTQVAEPTREETPVSTLGIARAAFESLDKPEESASTPSELPTPQPPQPQQPTPAAPKVPTKRPLTVDLTADDEEPPPKKLERSKSTSAAAKGKGKAAPKGNQPKLAAFWSTPAKGTPKASPPPTKPSASKPSTSASTPSTSSKPPDELPPDVLDCGPDTEKDALLAQALAEADEERQRAREAKKEEAAPVWSGIFAKKLPPLCTVHQKPCKDFIVKIQGPNKGKRFWLCSLPVGPGYDKGRSKRPRDEVDRQYKCDFFLWDSANSRKETPKAVPKKEQ